MTDAPDSSETAAEWFADGEATLTISLRLPVCEGDRAGEHEPDYGEWMAELREAANEGVLLQYAEVESLSIGDIGLLDGTGKRID